MSEWIRRLAEKYSEVNEKKKLDPVGQADADIDNDGDVDKSDKYLHNRRKAIGKAMKNEEKDMSGMCCKNCGDKFGEPKSESCMYDAYNAEGKNWIKMENYKEDVDLEEATISAKMARRALASVKAQPKDKVSLKKAPWDKEDKKKVDEEEVIMNPKKVKDKKAEAETMANEAVEELDEISADLAKRALDKRDAQASQAFKGSRRADALKNRSLDKARKRRDREIGTYGSKEREIAKHVDTAKKADTKAANLKHSAYAKSKKADKTYDYMKKRGMKTESALPPVYARILEERAKHYKGATPPEGMMDNSKSSKGAMDMVNQPKKINNDDEKGHDDASKAGRVGPSAKARPGDNMKGDKKVIPSATPMKGK